MAKEIKIKISSNYSDGSPIYGYKASDEVHVLAYVLKYWKERLKLKVNYNIKAKNCREIKKPFIL